MTIKSGVSIKENSPKNSTPFIVCSSCLMSLHQGLLTEISEKIYLLHLEKHVERKNAKSDLTVAIWKNVAGIRVLHKKAWCMSSW